MYRVQSFILIKGLLKEKGLTRRISWNFSIEAENKFSFKIKTTLCMLGLELIIFK
jgi:hypothetical protein